MDELKQEPQTKKISLKDIKNLVFQGGSVKGIAYIGAYKSLLDAGLSFEQLENIGGTSAGAINAVLLSVNCSHQEALKLMQTLNFKELLDNDAVSADALLNLKEKTGFAFFGSLVSTSLDSTSSRASSALKNSFGLFHGEVIRKWVENVLKERTGIDHITFEELHILKLKNPKLYKDIYVTGMNVNNGQTEVFSWKDTPNAIVSDSVRISMSIPFVFKPHQKYIKESGMRIVDPKYAETLYIDGGVNDNYPLFLFDTYEYLPDPLKEKIGNQGGLCANPETLGFKLVERERKDFLMGITPESSQKNLVYFFPFFKAVLSSIYHKQESDHVLAKEQWRTIYIDTCGINTLDFDLNETKQNILMESGKKAVEEFFDIHISSKSNFSFS